MQWTGPRPGLKGLLAYLRQVTPWSLLKFKSSKGSYKKLKNLFKDEAKKIIKDFTRTYSLKGEYPVFERIRSVCTQRDSRIVIAIRSIAVTLDTAMPGADFQPLVKHLFKRILAEGLDPVLNDWKTTVGAIRNELGENQLERSVKKKDLNKDQSLIYEQIEGKFPETMEPMDKLWIVGTTSQTRILPPASGKVRSKKVIEYIRGMLSPPHESTVTERIPVRGPKWRVPKYAWKNQDFIEPGERVWDQTVYQGTYNLGKLIADDINFHINDAETKEPGIRNTIVNYHTSLTGSSSQEFTRAEGGKWAALKEDGPFRNWMLLPIDANFTLKGDIYVDRFGNKVTPKEWGSNPTWSSAYLDTPLEGEFGDGLVPGWLGEVAFANGIDTRLGTLFLCWAYGDRDDWKRRFDPSNPETFPKGRISIITEPGLKIRPVTAGETWLNVFLSPAAHRLTSLVGMLPAASVGLTDTAGLWRFSQAAAGKDDDAIGDFISTSDMTSATDRVGHESANGILSGLIEGLEDHGIITKGEREYLQDAADLLTTPRLLSYKTKGGEARELKHLFFKTLGCEPEKDGDKKVFTFLSERGVLMGEPLTKIVLTLSSYGAWLATRLGFRTIDKVKRLPSMSRNHTNVSIYACAGDDHIGIGSAEGLKKIPVMMESMFYEISWDKYMISRILVSYCQEYGLHPKVNPMPEDGIGSHSGTIHIDIPRLRLLNQFQKMGGRENFDKPDPLIGKAKALEAFVKSAKERLERVNYVSTQCVRYAENLSRFIDSILIYLRLLMPSWLEEKILKNKLSYLPTVYGGLGIPLPDNIRIEEDEQILKIALQIQKDAMLWDDRTEKVVFERGITQRDILVGNLIRKVMFDQEPLSRREAEERARARIQLESGNTNRSVSNMAVTKRVFKDYLDLSGEIPVVDSKENAYVALGLDPNKKIGIVKKERARQYLAKLSRKIAKLPEPGQLDKLDPGFGKFFKRPGAFVDKDSVLETLQTGFACPSLKIPRRLFHQSTNTRQDVGPSWPVNLQFINEFELQSSPLINQRESTASSSQC